MFPSPSHLLHTLTQGKLLLSGELDARTPPQRLISWYRGGLGVVQVTSGEVCGLGMENVKGRDNEDLQEGKEYYSHAGYSSYSCTFKI